VPAPYWVGLQWWSDDDDQRGFQQLQQESVVQAKASSAVKLPVGGLETGWPCEVRARRGLMRDTHLSGRRGGTARVQPSVGERPASNASRASSTARSTRSTYRVVARTSEVDESLFGNTKPKGATGKAAKEAQVEKINDGSKYLKGKKPQLKKEEDPTDVVTVTASELQRMRVRAQASRWLTFAVRAVRPVKKPVAHLTGHTLRQGSAAAVRWMGVTAGCVGMVAWCGAGAIRDRAAGGHRGGQGGGPGGEEQDTCGGGACGNAL
jgi:hypothetical protein